MAERLGSQDCPRCGERLVDEANRFCRSCRFYRRPDYANGEKSTDPFDEPHVMEELGSGTSPLEGYYPGADDWEPPGPEDDPY